MKVFEVILGGLSKSGQERYYWVAAESGETLEAALVDSDATFQIVLTRADGAEVAYTLPQDLEPLRKVLASWQSVPVQLSVLRELQRAAEHAIGDLSSDVEGLRNDGEDTDDLEDLIDRWNAALEKVQALYGPV